MGKKPFEKYNLEDDEAFEKYLQAIGANIFEINEPIEEVEQKKNRLSKDLIYLSKIVFDTI